MREAVNKVEALQRPKTQDISLEDVERGVASATRALTRLAHADGHICFELEADATIPSEYILFHQFRATNPRPGLEAKIGNYLRRTQGKHGGWALVHDGPFDISASVKAYFALKMIGDDIEAPHMRRAREAILSRGGAANANVFTRFMLALYGEVPWTAVPVMPVEVMFLPKWFPFHLDKVSYWARCVMVPLFVLQAAKPRALNPRGIGVQELFVTPPEHVRSWPGSPHATWPWTPIFGGIDKVLQKVENFFPKRPRLRAKEKAVAWVSERLNGEDGLGAIFPAMVNSVLMYEVMGYPAGHPQIRIACEAIEKLVVEKDHEAYVQPCVSPVWDTALASHALLEAGGAEAERQARDGLDWLKPRQVLDIVGDWAAAKPNVRPGGWAFQYANAHYPDLDDTAVVVMAMNRAMRQHGLVADMPDYSTSIARAREWVEGLQSKDGGWAAFDADNNHMYLNHIPFSDHGALLDPPTADVTARVVSMLAQLGETRETSQALDRGVAYLLKEQEKDGSWYGRWGMNFIYGTWSVLCALNAAGIDPDSPEIRRAVAWLISIQNPDGGWGEDASSYKIDPAFEPGYSTASQTAWALLALMAVGAADEPAVTRGINYLARTQGGDGFWNEERYTATGFPRVFYLRYHGYSKFFPLWAMARYRNLKKSNSRQVAFGM
ncbi:squalene--hopene cyclase [Methylobacterium oxalidis]|uniref:Squalene--hopene cyclase n=1 Tax=Methylobacterium oxalidis TaxID=944322 RepID=A0A512J545_9HYPH|nr:squalene--hopene cyclase [Methylobacterium oxalidis]GEP05094.1 putative squalene--hopene cyclase [Methylobacterium oxalidis]GJE35884.1 Squalene--hopene cyclase [Methylobacterium oxalidis]GLS65627.1 putative squalene--hopene cyclase [Methylobacterium oxalidis]